MTNRMQYGTRTLLSLPMSDYQFAKAPNPPKVTAVPGDGKVTLYWDRSAESTQDKYMGNITTVLICMI